MTNIKIVSQSFKKLIMSIGTIVFDKNTSLSNRVGIESTDMNLFVILVLDSIENVGRTLEQKNSIVRWEKNCYNREILISQNSYVLLKFQKHNWTLIYQLYFGKFTIAPFIHQDASLFSKILNTKAIFYEVSDSDFCLGYYFYNRGELIERFLYAESFIRWEDGVFRETPAEAYEEDYPGDYRFYSKLRKLSEEYIFSHYYDIVDSFLKQEGTYIPSIFWNYQIPINQTVIFQIKNLKSNDIERLDYIVCSS